MDTEISIPEIRARILYMLYQTMDGAAMQLDLRKLISQLRERSEHHLGPRPDEDAVCAALEGMINDEQIDFIKDNRAVNFEEVEDVLWSEGAFLIRPIDKNARAAYIALANSTNQPILKTEKKLSRIPNHTIFIDVKSYSTKTDEEQIEIIQELTNIVKKSLELNEIVLNKDCYALPTGDGMALCLISSIPEKCARLAIAIVKGVIENAKFQIRVGINFAYDFQYTDINGRTNIAGVGINVAARVESAAKDKPNMILVSSTVAEQLNASREFRSRLRSVGERATKDRNLANLHELLLEETQTTTDSIKFEQRAEVVKVPAPKPLCRIVGAHFYVFNDAVKMSVMIVNDNSPTVGNDSILDILIRENKHYIDDIKRSKVDCSFSKNEKGDNVFTLTAELPRSFARVPENEDTIYLKLECLDLVRHINAPCDDRLVPARVTFQNVNIGWLKT